MLLVTLFFWDLMDLYVELRNFRFIFTFAAYYFLRYLNADDPGA